MFGFSMLSQCHNVNLITVEPSNIGHLWNNAMILFSFQRLLLFLVI